MREHLTATKRDDLFVLLQVIKGGVITLFILSITKVGVEYLNKRTNTRKH